MTKYLIIGGGAAGTEAALELRRRSQSAEIVLLSEEEVLPYRRPNLTRTLCGETVPDSQFYQKPELFYTENRIDLKLGERALEIDRSSAAVKTSSGAVFHYDRLLLAAGASARTLPVPGGALPHVFKGRTLRDFTSLETFIAGKDGLSAVVIGGGLLGLEFAEGLLCRNIRVTVVEAFPTPMPKQLDCRGAGIFSAMLTARNGLTARYGRCVKNIGVDAVTLDNGEIIGADVVIWSVGAAPNTALASYSGLAVKRGIVTDRFMRTGDPAVFAAGDCAEANGCVTGLWNPAKEQGRVAAVNMSGGAEEYSAGFQAARFVGFGTRMYSAGLVGLEGDGVVTEYGGDGVKTYSALTSRNGKLVGILLLGDVSSALQLERRLDFSE
ncbi:MAG: FAD-dependent oxidoreductase [Victivallaceae bacterium]|nr:FAD-dependent oxidoreductase [Victivallaceae bacterium]